MHSGRIRFREDVELGFEIDGVVADVAVTEGDRVEAGDLLARMRAADRVAAVEERQAALRRARADLEAARVRRRMAELIAERREDLSRRELLAPEDLELADADLDARTAALEAARAGVVEAESALERSRVLLGYTELRAPFAGVVATLPLRVGQAVVAGAGVLRLVALDRARVHAGIAPDAANTMAVDDRVVLDIGDARIPARIAALAPVLDERTRTVPVILEPDRAPEMLRVGQLVEIRTIERVEETGAWLPLEALVEGRRGLWSGYFLVADEETGSEDGILTGRIERRPLRVLQLAEDRVFVRGPIADGDVHLRAALHRAVPGQIVRLTLD
ncbi:MAG: efflux RND transporter periplasmic adaptor subunit [Gammaproteobacteria bacterium]|nr:efflux RND transporter periplasmic adaptor subunit [Gammaproteobacteria bacterium]